MDTHGQWARCHANVFALYNIWIYATVTYANLSNSRTGNTAQIYGNEWGTNPEVWTLDHQI